MDNSNETPSLAPIPSGWKRTQRAPIMIDGIEWRSYRSGVNSYTLVANHPIFAAVSRTIGNGQPTAPMSAVKTSAGGSVQTVPP